MKRTVLRDDQWKRLKDLSSGKAGDCGVTASDNRLFFFEAALDCSPWQDLPAYFGYRHRVFYMRYNRWPQKGTWTENPGCGLQ